MKLTVFERLLLRNIVPQIQGWNYANLKDARNLIEGLFTEKEEADLQLKQEGKGVTWRIQKDSGVPIPQEKEIEVCDGLKSKLGKYLENLGKEEKLSFEHMTLYEKFVDDKPAQ